MIAPKVTYFLPLNSEIRPFANIFAGYSRISNSVGKRTISTNGFVAGGGIGAAYFLTKNVALSLELGYTFTQQSSKAFEEKENVSGFASALGFSIFF